MRYMTGISMKDLKKMNEDDVNRTDKLMRDYRNTSLLLSVTDMNEYRSLIKDTLYNYRDFVIKELDKMNIILMEDDSGS